MSALGSVIVPRTFDDFAERGRRRPKLRCRHEDLDLQMLEQLVLITASVRCVDDVCNLDDRLRQDMAEKEPCQHGALRRTSAVLRRVQADVDEEKHQARYNSRPETAFGEAILGDRAGQKYTKVRNRIELLQRKGLFTRHTSSSSTRHVGPRPHRRTMQRNRTRDDAMQPGRTAARHSPRRST